MKYAVDDDVKALAEAFGRDMGEVKPNVRKINTNATRAPLPSDDETQGYAAGSRWLWQGQEWVAVLVGSTLRWIAQQGVVIPEMFGAKGDGVAYDNAALQAAVQFAAGRELILRGKFRLSGAPGSQIEVPSGTTIRGINGGGVVLDDRPEDTDVTGRAFFLRNTENVSFIDVVFDGCADVYDNPAPGRQMMAGINNKGLTIRGCTFRNLRFMATSFGNTEGALFEGNTLENIARDGARFTHSRNVRVIGNLFKNVSDDAVALHSKDEDYPTAPMPSGFVVADNTFEGSQGVRVYGAKGLTVTGNTFRRPVGHALDIQLGTFSSAEGNTAIFAVNITGNVILDALRPWRTSAPEGAITIKTVGRKKGELAQQPGVALPAIGHLYTNNIDASAAINVGGQDIIIANNIISRTLPAVAAYSEWGYGRYFEHRNSGSLWSDPPMGEDVFDHHGIVLSAALSGVSISGNIISGLSPNRSPIKFVAAGSSNIIDIGQTIINGNIFRDCPGHGVDLAFTGSGAASKAIVVTNNLFDLDPYRRHPDHAADNTWAATASIRAVNALTGGHLLLTGNTFRHLSQPSTLGAANAQYYDNVIWSMPAEDGDIPGNKGVRVVDQTQRNVIYDADPTSATFGHVLTNPATAANTMPTSGTYVRGHFVRRTQPLIAGTAGAQYVVTGWVRLTTGSGHVLNVDWAEVRSPSGS